jgi:hypothetical protein
MEKAMKKALFGLTFLALGLSAVAATAGQFSSQPVLLGANWAQGSIVSARTSADANQHIGCRVNTLAGSESGQCWGQNSAGTLRTCMLTSAALRTTAKAINQTSWVRFEFDTATSACTRLDVLNGSNYTNY